MTLVGVNRIRYAAHEPRPSRFTDPTVYAAWCTRADLWAGGAS
jgi:hypothetical protein